MNNQKHTGKNPSDTFRLQTETKVPWRALQTSSANQNILPNQSFCLGVYKTLPCTASLDPHNSLISVTPDFR